MILQVCAAAHARGQAAQACTALVRHRRSGMDAAPP
eukprot:CAMPEP_0176186282 /NCGR_PEP_ID=MMETSP0121_2-20121125/1788_1 /TAXON_ID=160619 /ORGANISM="Kryptoperidinium foliaceum, Strain CCMP 1326" /LENGTH=35 /DNA_ID= /DNA_START= /DNA_END= /DNA_ORIENTATION=